MIKEVCCLLFCFGFILIGCGTNTKETTANDQLDSIPVINLARGVVENSSFSISDVAKKVEIVSLEVTDGSILADISKLLVTDNDIWIKHYKEERILRFSRSGKFLNFVGKIGQGPEEYITLYDFNVDESQKEVYVISALYGVKVYDYEGHYKRRATNQKIDDMFTATKEQFVFYNQSIYLSQNLCVQKPIANPKDSLWSIALVDSMFKKKKIFKNPIHIGKEILLVEHRSKPESFDIVNYWTEHQTSIGLYGNEFTVKYPDTDTIYLYNVEHEDFVPQYSILTEEEKGDYEFTHLWIKERKAFDYFTLINYYPTLNYIYLVGSKGKSIYTYCYNKEDGTVKLEVRDEKMIERKLPWFSQPHMFLPHSFVLKNDLSGGDFVVDFCSSGKFWIDVLGQDEKESRIDKVKTSSVKDSSSRKELVKALENMDEDSNPILLIAVLK